MTFSSSNRKYQSAMRRDITYFVGAKQHYQDRKPPISKVDYQSYIGQREHNDAVAYATSGYSTRYLDNAVNRQFVKPVASEQVWDFKSAKARKNGTCQNGLPSIPCSNKANNVVDYEIYKIFANNHNLKQPYLTTSNFQSPSLKLKPNQTARHCYLSNSVRRDEIPASFNQAYYGVGSRCRNVIATDGARACNYYKPPSNRLTYDNIVTTSAADKQRVRRSFTYDYNSAVTSAIIDSSNRNYPQYCSNHSLSSVVSELIYRLDNTFGKNKRANKWDQHDYCTLDDLTEHIRTEDHRVHPSQIATLRDLADCRLLVCKVFNLPTIMTRGQRLRPPYFNNKYSSPMMTRTRSYFKGNR
ncbi:hypothetical protein GJ496_003899 [Pomphorhynchus laevis]|nr:hypothetical protein GJ496_003899 [Pomphorhynchus laevis]